MHSLQNCSNKSLLKTPITNLQKQQTTENNANDNSSICLLQHSRFNFETSKESYLPTNNLKSSKDKEELGAKNVLH